MTLRMFVAFFSSFGVLLFRPVGGSRCSNPLNMLYKDKKVDIDKLLKVVIGQSTNAPYYDEGAFTNAAKDCRLKAGCDIQLLFKNKETLTVCFSTKQTKCFSLNCSCLKNREEGGQNTKGLRQSSEFNLECTSQNTEISDTCHKKEEETTTLGDTSGNKKPENMQTTSMKSDGPEKDPIRFKPLPLTVAFILGITIGSLATIITIHLCRSRTLRQNPNDKRADLSEEILLYIKGLGDTSVYSEILENNKNSQVLLGSSVEIGEYTEPLSKNNTVTKATIPLKNLYEKDESNQYQELTLESGNTDQNIYNHLQPNNGTNRQVSIHREDRCVDPLYHTLAFAKIGNSDENPHDAAQNLLNDNSSSNSDATETKHIKTDEIPNGKPFSMCENTEQLISTEKVETDEESEEPKEESNIENAYFVLEKKE